MMVCSLANVCCADDIQMADPEGIDNVVNGFWVPRGWSPVNTSSPMGAVLFNSSINGTELANISLPDTHNGVRVCEDDNHAQLLERDTKLFVSCRNTSTLVLYNRLRGEIEWVLGGKAGDFDIIEADGTFHEKGSLRWFGQHNAEYFGDSEVFMFDDQFGRYAPSRIISVRVDNTSKVANITWEFVIPYAYPYGYSPIFGEADRLPTGNVLSQFWPSTQEEGTMEFDLRIFEVATATNDFAWAVDVYSHPNATFSGGRKASSGGYGDTPGWLSYSSERFYDSPLVWKVSWSDDVISFKTVNSLKQSHQSRGHYRIVDASESTIVSGSFLFVPHWKTTEVAIGLTSGPSASARVEVWNEWGQVTRKALS